MAFDLLYTFIIAQILIVSRGLGAVKTLVNSMVP